jgi:hypothetical protein
MTGPVADAARSAAVILAPDLGPNLPADVEAALAARGTQQRPNQYLDPLALASLIVGIASLAWTVYTDLKKRTAKPAAEAVARTVRIKLRDSDQADPPDRIVEVVVTETIRAAADQEVTDA